MKIPGNNNLHGIGDYLKKTRQSKKLTLTQVAEGTKITLRYLEALENNHFAILPSETYAMGFLRSYAMFLELDVEQVLNQYRTEILMREKLPLKELTEPVISWPDQLSYYIRFAIVPVALLTVGVVMYLLVQENAMEPDYTNQQNTSTKKTNTTFQSILLNAQNKTIPQEKTEPVTFKRGVLTALLQKNGGIDFLVSGKSVYFILREIKYKTINNQYSTAIIEVYPRKTRIELTEQEAYSLKDNNILRLLQVILLGATPNNIKLRVILKEENQGAIEELTKYTSHPQSNGLKNTKDILKPEHFIISLEVKILGDNYIEFYVDGRQIKRGLVGSGEVFSLQASNSIQLKIGDAGAAKVSINGKPIYTGSKGQQISKIIRKVKDPIQQLKYKVDIRDM